MTLTLENDLNTIRPSQVLYYYDEPLIFFSDSDRLPLLVIKVDEEDGLSEYLAVIASSSLVDDLKAGKVSLRAAFMQPWCWLISTNEMFEIKKLKGMPVQKVPKDFFPAPGVGLYAHHGFIRDAFSREVSDA